MRPQFLSIGEINTKPHLPCLFGPSDVVHGLDISGEVCSSVFTAGYFILQHVELPPASGLLLTQNTVTYKLM